MEAVTAHAPTRGIRPVCAALGVPRATYYRKLRPWHGPRRWTSPRALSTSERVVVLEALHELRFCELAPAEVYATLLDEGRYLCSERTMYRVLAANREVRERRDQLRHPAYAAPELLATAPNQLWSWDITKLLGPTTLSYFYLYVVLDVFSRYVVGWMVAKLRVGDAREEALSRNLRTPRHRARPADAPRRPRLVNEIQVPRPHAR